ncbi:hypothetical protein [Spirochaeta cellobiosiphila]|uniref:hypothetical protein n=1 Tax=Spirochaeta cellobiosiphila TaxID=504483 RepID=UPI0003F92542|nr:hypothetical protein [Spirochaeta cellobiosiphila]
MNVREGQVKQFLGPMVLSIILYLSNIFSVFCLVPLLSYYKKGREKQYVLGSTLLILVMMINHGIPIIQGKIQLLGLVTLFDGTLVLAVIGVAIVNLWPFHPMRKLYRIIIVTLFAACFIVPFLENPVVQSSSLEELNKVIKVLRDTGSGMGFAGLSSESFSQILYDSLVGTMVSFYMALVGGSMWFAKNFRLRYETLDSQPESVKTFKVSDVWVWFFILPLLGILAIIALGVLSVPVPGWSLHIITNLSMMAMLVYGWQGIGIIVFWLDRVQAGPLLRLFLRTLLIALFFLPGLNLLLLIFPLLGVSETWINYRDPKRS